MYLCTKYCWDVYIPNQTFSDTYFVIIIKKKVKHDLVTLATEQKNPIIIREINFIYEFVDIRAITDFCRRDIC